MSQKDRIIQAFSKMAPDYEHTVSSELQHFWGWSYEEFLELVFNGDVFFDEESVLDIGTGTGVIPDRLVELGKVALPVHGLDITLPMLEQAMRRFEQKGVVDQIALVCATAMEMPYADETFSHVICGLATHHMSVERLLSESWRILRRGGRLTLADAGGAPSWKIPGMKLLLKLAAFIYFGVTADLARAWIEASAVSNVRTQEQWIAQLEQTGYKDINIVVVKSKHAWISVPLCIKAAKS
jgi:ubiquinone/menaquinone biosynthesis C-methylase UbiE